MYAHRAPAHGWLGLGWLGHKAILIIAGIAVALLLAGCGGGGESQDQAQVPPGNPADNTAFAFNLPGYSSPSSAGTTSPLSTALDDPAEPNRTTLNGQLLPIVDGEPDGRVIRFALRVTEGDAIIVEEFNVHVDPDVYNFYVVLSDGTQAYGGFLTNWQILDDPRNIVTFTMFPLADPNMDVRALRTAVDAGAIVELTYDSTLVDPTTGELKLQYTLTDLNGDPILDAQGNLQTRTLVVTHALAGGSVTIFGTAITPPHQFYYGGVIVLAPVDQSATNDETPLLQYTIDDPCFAAGTCNEVVLIDGVATTARNGDPLIGLDDGTYALTIIFTDGDDPEDTTEVVSIFTIDATPPTVILEPPPPGGTGEPIENGGTIGSGDGDVTVSTNESGVLKVYLDPDAACLAEINAGNDGSGPCDDYLVDEHVVADGEVVTTSLTGLSDGEHSLHLVAVDDLGNQSVQVITFTVVPPTAPIVTVTEPALPLYGSRTVPLAYSATDDDPGGPTIDILVQQFDAGTGTWNTASGATIDSTIITVATDGHYRVRVSATDSDSLTTTVTRNFSVDTTAPAVTIVQPAHGSTVADSKPQLEVHATEQSAFNTRIFLFAGEFREPEDADWLDIPIDGRLQQQNGDPLVDGVYTVVVELTDAVGLPGVAYATFTVNAVGPHVVITNPVDDAIITNGIVNLRYNVNDASHVEIWLASDADPTPSAPLLVREIDPVQPVPRTYQNDIAVPIDGDYTLTLVAKDTALPGVTGEDSVSFTADSLRPQVQIISPAPGNRVFPTGVPVDVVFTAAGATQYQVYLDWRLVEEGTLDGAATTVTVSVGPFTNSWWHHVKVKVGDGVSWAWDRSWFLIDGIAPRVSILSPEPDQVIAGGSVTVVYKVRELLGVQSETVWLNGVVQAGFRSGDTLHGLAPSATPYLLEVEAIDFAGNSSGRVGVSFFIVADDGPGDGSDRRRGRASCMHTPIAGDDDALQALLECVRHKRGQD